MQTATIDRTKKWSVDDYLLLGESLTPCELINGELIMSPAPSPAHQRTLRKLFKIFDRLNPQGELFFAPVDLYINATNVVQPDLIYISNTNKDFISTRGIEGPPDIVVEVISPSNVFTDRNPKKKVYLEFGIKEYWIVDPANKTLEIYLCTQPNTDTPYLYLAEEGPVTSTVLTSLAFDLKEVFIS